MEETTSIAMSPIPPQKSDGLRGKILVDFYTALKEISDGKKRATRIEWQDANQYMFFKAEILHIARQLPDNQYPDHKFIIGLGDVVADDLIVLE